LSNAAALLERAQLQGLLTTCGAVPPRDGLAAASCALTFWICVASLQRVIELDNRTLSGVFSIRLSIRPIQIRLTASSLVKSHQPVKQSATTTIPACCEKPIPLAANANRRFQFHKRSQLFIRVYNEPVSVVAR
jgi:hypothetical protein